MKFVIFIVENGITAIGGRYISAAIKAAGHISHIVFLPKNFDDFETESELDQIDRCIASEKPDIIGVSLMSNHLRRVIKLTSRIQNRHGLKVIWGGVHPTCVPESCLRYADAVCIGEAENTLAEMASRHSKGYGFEDIPGLWYRNPEGIMKSGARPKAENLDSLSWQDHDKNDHTILHNGILHPMSDEIMRNYIYASNGMHFIITSRGCPYHCSFCCNDKLSEGPGARVRRRSVANVIGEARHLLDVYSFTSSFAFWDDAFLTCTPDWLEEFCETYKREIGQPFFCNMHPRDVTPDRLEMLVNAGLMGIQMGLQTGSDRINSEVFDRHTGAADFERAAALLHQVKNRVLDRHYHVIVDNPWETEDDRAQTLEAVNRIGKPFYLSRLSLMFYPGTRIHQKALHEGIIKSEDANEVYIREYYEHHRTYENLLLRIAQASPAGLVRFFQRFRKSRFIRSIFYLYYYGFYSVRYRLWNRWKFNSIRKRLWADIPQSSDNRRELLEAAIKYRPL
jgi:anaerobic magnesium-protoporphyrin IX monomethyl ester cyclase